MEGLKELITPLQKQCQIYPVTVSYIVYQLQKKVTSILIIIIHVRLKLFYSLQKFLHNLFTRQSLFLLLPLKRPISILKLFLLMFKVR